MYDLIVSHVKLILPVQSIQVLALLCAALLFSLSVPSSSLAAEAASGEAISADAPVAGVRPVWSAGGVSLLAIQDLAGNMSVDLFSGPASPEERAKFFQNGQAPAGVNVFLIQAQGQTPAERPLNILVDSGFGMAGASKLMSGLAAAKIAPEQIDIVLLTHMHTDHIGGLLGADGQRVFPNAQIMVSRPEKDYWTGDPSAARDNAALAARVFAAYSNGLPQSFEYGKLNLPASAAQAGLAVEALDASGHTPGHSVFMLEAAGKKLLIIGDLVHAAALQFALPDECARYDTDMPQAVKARKRILGLAAEQEIEIAGMHIPFPGSGEVTAQFNLRP